MLSKPVQIIVNSCKINIHTSLFSVHRNELNALVGTVTARFMNKQFNNNKKYKIFHTYYVQIINNMFFINIEIKYFK